MIYIEYAFEVIVRLCYNELHFKEHFVEQLHEVALLYYSFSFHYRHSRHIFSKNTVHG
jgi:hypothetical protein